jgi:hypothetical protein
MSRKSVLTMVLVAAAVVWAANHVEAVNKILVA